MPDQIKLLNERVHLMEMINDASIDGIMVFDTGYHVVYWNRVSELITGVNAEAARGRYFFDVFPYFSDCKDINNALTQALRGRKSFLPYEKASHPEGYHEHHFIPLKRDDDTVLGILVIVHDVAHRIKVEKELKSLNRSLVRKNKQLKSTNAELLAFSHVTSHDLKEPLHKIYSFTEMILEKEAGNLSDTGRAHFKRIQAAAQRMRLLTDDITTYAHINTAKATLSDVDLNHVLLLVISNLQDEINTKSAVVEMEQLPVIYGSRTLLLTLFQNIVGNALKFQEPGNKPHINISCEMLSGDEMLHPDASADLQYIRISITDNGIGFEPQKAEEIFQMFNRLNPGAYPGTGIGLSICKKIAELHSGFITADSLGSNGSTFNIFLPALKKRIG